MIQRCLMLGNGHRKPHRKFSAPTSLPEEQTLWDTVDMNPAANPTIIVDLEMLERGQRLELPSGVYDEIHMYETLEHFGKQGDFKGFFSTFRELWRLLKPAGWLVATVPSLKSEWLWADPGHCRAISHGTLCFLCKEHYEQLGKTPSSDYREFVDPFWWELIDSVDNETTYRFALRKVV